MRNAKQLGAAAVSLYVATYDISRNSSRRQVANVLLRYGRRVQWSVFEVDMEPEELSELKRQIGPWLASTDHFDLFPIDTRRPGQRIRWQSEPYGDSVRLF